MRPLIIVIESVALGNVAAMPYAHEPVQIQAFIPELSVETLHIGIIDRPPRTDEMKLYPALICPCIQGVADKLRAVVYYNVFRNPPKSGYLT